MMARLRLLSYNIDGLSDTGLALRAKEVVNVVKRHVPDVVYFQELVAENLPIIQKGLSAAGYTLHDGGASEKFPYFCAIALRQATAIMRPGSGELTVFEGSRMFRHLLRLEADVRGVHMRFLTSHLESLGDPSSAAARRNQFAEALTDVSTSDADLTIFAGDTNLRDTEAVEVREEILGAKRASVPDAWEALGSNAATKWTWDMMRNKNLSMNGTPRCRFDRVYFKAGKPGISPASFALVGTEVIPGSGLHPSDHFGVLVEFDVPPVDPPAPMASGDASESAASSSSSAAAGAGAGSSSSALPFHSASSNAYSGASAGMGSQPASIAGGKVVAATKDEVIDLVSDED